MPHAGTVEATWSCVKGGLPGLGNISVDPLFADPASGSVALAPGSPCIDAADPAAATGGTDVGRDPRTLDGSGDGIVRRDMGADEHSRLQVFTALVPGGVAVVVTGASFPQSRVLVGLPGTPESLGRLPGGCKALAVTLP